jgi:hypothetical protein
MKIKKGLQSLETLVGVGARVGIRTPNLLIRSQVLYPIELRMHISRNNLDSRFTCLNAT